MSSIFLKIATNAFLAWLLCFADSCFGQTNNAVKLTHYDGPPAYKDAVSKLMLSEVNSYAFQLTLSEQLPITTNSLKELFISSPFLAVRFGILGSLQTTNYSYGFGKGKHLCYITRIIKGTNPFDYDANKLYAIDPSAVNTNAAYLLATQFLARAFVDLNRLSTSSVVTVRAVGDFAHDDQQIHRPMGTQRQASGKSRRGIASRRTVDVARRRPHIDYQEAA